MVYEFLLTRGKKKKETERLRQQETSSWCVSFSRTLRVRMPKKTPKDPRRTRKIHAEPQKAKEVG